MAAHRNEAKFAARGGMTRSQVKEAVRDRDGHACTQCGLTADAHRRRYGRTLDVHRLVPGSLYTLPGCVTLCRECHGTEPKREPGQQDADGYGRGYMVRIPAAYHARLVELARRNRRPIVSELRIALDAYLTANGLTPPPS